MLLLLPGSNGACPAVDGAPRHWVGAATVTRHVWASRWQWDHPTLDHVSSAGLGHLLWHTELMLYSISMTCVDTDESRKLFEPSAPACCLTCALRGKLGALCSSIAENAKLSKSHLSGGRSGKQQLAYTEHGKIPIGVDSFNCTCVRIPGMYSDGSCVIWCPTLGRGDLAAVRARMAIRQRVYWSERSRHGTPHHVFCQYKSLSSTTSGWVFRFPLNVTQAFGMAMTTICWTLDLLGQRVRVGRQWVRLIVCASLA